MDGFRAEQVMLAVGPPLVLAAGRQCLAGQRPLREGGLVAHQHLAGHDVQADAADARCGPGEMLVNDVLADANSLEELGTVIALHGRHAHLGHDLDHALGGGLGEVPAGRLVVDSRQQSVADHPVQRLEGQVGVDRTGAIADQQREVMHFPGFAGLDNEARPHAQAFPDQEVVQAGHREQGGDRRQFPVNAPVAEDQDVDVLGFDQPPRLLVEVLQRAGQALLAPGCPEQDGQHRGLEARHLEPPHAGELLVGQHRPWQLQPAAVGGLGLEQVALGTEPHLRGRDQLFADAVDGWIRDLGEELLEIIEQQLRPAGEGRERCVVAHRAYGLDAIPPHGRQDDALVLEGVAEGQLPLEQGVVVRRRHFPCRGQLFQHEQMLVQPLPVGALAGHRLLDLLVLDDPALGGIDEEHPAGLQATLAQDVGGRNIQHAGLRGHHHQVVLGHVVARRAQTVAVEHRADHLAIGEGDRRRAVPGLHQAGVVLVEGPQPVIHPGMVRPGLRDHHHHRVRQGASGQHQQFEHVVEHRGVAAIGIDDGRYGRHVLAEQLGFEQRLPGMHPVDVAAERVDLAVVGQIAVGMRPVPAREGVGAEARVHHRECRLHRGIEQVGVVLGELLGEQHALVDQRLAGQAADVPEIGTVNGRGADLAVGALADDVQLALEGPLVGLPVVETRVPPDEDLAHEGLGAPGGFAQRGIAGGHGAPAQHGLALGLHDLLELLLELAPLARAAGQKQQTAAVFAGCRQRNALGLGGLQQEAVGHLQQHTGAVARVHLAAAGTAVIQVAQHLDGLCQDGVGFAPLDVHDEAHPAGVVLVGRVIEPLPGRGQVRGLLFRGQAGPARPLVAVHNVSRGR